jgi:hypothetical protein
MDLRVRKELRDQVLEELYEFHFANRGKLKNVVREIEKDDEKYLAYRYLNEGSLIVFNEYSIGNGDEEELMSANAGITSFGIDTVEDRRL